MKVCLACDNHFDSVDWSCPRCGKFPARHGGFLSFAPSLSDTSEGFEAAFFDTLALLEPGNFWFESRNRLLIEMIHRYFPTMLGSGNFLEIGCGTGFVLSRIHTAFSTVNMVGSEIFDQGLRYAKQRLPDATLIQMDARQIPFVDEFDFIGIFDVLEHIAEDEQVLSQMFQAVKPGGGIMITVPQHRFLWSAMDEYGHHCRRYMRPELVGKVRAAGFEVMDTTSFVSLLMPLIVISRMRAKAIPETYNPMSEFRLSPFVNASLSRIMDIERFAIRLGISFPFGGSLFLAAQRPTR